MVILSFHEDTRDSLMIHKMKKSSSLPQMASDEKKEVTLFSSTLKVEENKVLYFFYLRLM